MSYKEFEQQQLLIKNRLLHMWKYLDLGQRKEKIEALEALMSESHFWDDSQEAQKVIGEVNELKEWTEPYDELNGRFLSIESLYPEVVEAEDEELLADLQQELCSIDKKLAELEIRRMLSGEMDNKNCYLTVNSGAGGTEACDWALMLSRMYQRWAARRGWDLEMLDCVDGDVAGVKSITFKISGPFAFGYCKAEKGVHRLVRISPFDTNAKRHTSFASIDVTPEVGDDILIDIRSEDLRIDTYRASGAGGQHVNKTDSAVRMTHIPSGVIVACQKERSQIQNREACLKMLKAKLYEKEASERKLKIDQMGGDKKEIAWGSQIRNYVFQPYTLVKDARTGVEMGNIQAVMDGDIDPFVIAYLKEFGA
ncbi:peptide chain release factor 2 [Rhabdochlamydiaceae symbiont of Dictyostelium giganteum]|uniref:peptide chain release factor 2 n=1 Tax=Rhabdochlamydiaceae symbiont of Dictyostelium giganteum TaxID=3342349 RepID=UPI00384F6C89